jgi:hypothetical protein
MQQIPILPQQPNYTIRTSQLAPTNRSLNPAADFSGTEESTKSGDNDDRLFWQEVSGRGKKWTSLTATKLPTMEKNKPQKTNKTQVSNNH